MKSVREVTREYNEMLRIDELQGEVDENRVNCYMCQCGHITKTIDVDKGVTPFMHECERCSNFAKSSFYNDVAPDLEPTQEWYRPTLKQVLKMRKKEFGDDMLYHVLQGGLENRKITK